MSARTRVISAAALLVVLLFTAAVFLDQRQPTVAHILGYQHYPDERGVIAIVAVGVLTDIVDGSVVEDATSVRISVRVRQPTGTVPLSLTYLPFPVSIHSGVRGRQVLDQDGTALQDLGAYRLPGPTPRP